MQTTNERITIPVGGASMGAYLARPTDGGKHPGVLVFQEIFGVNHHIRSVADRVAADGYISADQVERIKQELTKHEIGHEVVVYPSVGHGFFCDERPDYSETAASDAWRRVKDLFREELR